MCIAVSFILEMYFGAYTPWLTKPQSYSDLLKLTDGTVLLKKSELPGSMLLLNPIQNQCNLSSTASLYRRVNWHPELTMGSRHAAPFPEHLLYPATHLLLLTGCTHTTVHTIVLSILKTVLFELLPSLLALAVYFTTLQNNFSYKNSSNNAPLLLY